MKFEIQNLSKILIVLTVIICCFCYICVVSLKPDGSDCLTPNGEGGACIPTQECQYMVEALESVKRPLSKTAMKQLNSYVCNTTHFKVCCPPGPIIIKEEQNVESKSNFFNVKSHRNFNLLPTNCGYFDINGVRIINGMNADLQEFPWMALLSFRESDNSKAFKCGGTIINERYILTAAHCLEERSRLVDVRLGEYDKSKEKDCLKHLCNDPVQEVAIEERIPHPNFKRMSYENDIGLLRVTPISFNEKNIRPVCLPIEVSEPINENTIDISGWGTTVKFGRSTANVMQRASIPRVSKEDCTKLYTEYKTVVIDDRIICAGGGSNESFACQGDSGGPIQSLERFQDNLIRYVQLGIVSLGPKTCSHASTFTSVKYYLEWILNNMKP